MIWIFQHSKNFFMILLILKLFHWISFCTSLQWEPFLFRRIFIHIFTLMSICLLLFIFFLFGSSTFLLWFEFWINQNFQSTTEYSLTFSLSSADNLIHNLLKGPIAYCEFIYPQFWITSWILIHLRTRIRQSVEMKKASTVSRQRQVKNCWFMLKLLLCESQKLLRFRSFIKNYVVWRSTSWFLSSRWCQFLK